jgi:hypothetical protein
MILCLGFKEIPELVTLSLKGHDLVKVLPNDELGEFIKLVKKTSDIEPIVAVLNPACIVADDEYFPDALLEFIDVFWVDSNLLVKDSSHVERVTKRGNFSGFLDFGEKSVEISSKVLLNIYSLLHQQKHNSIREKFQLEGLIDNYNEVVEHLEKKLKLNKDAFDKYRQNRTVKTQAFDFYYQFKIGVNPGAEYCEFIENNDSIFMVHFSTSKYSESSLFLAYLEHLKTSKEALSIFQVFDNLVLQLEDFYGEERKEYDVALFLMEIKTKKLSANIIRYGGYEFYSSFKNNSILGNSRPLNKAFVNSCLTQLNFQRGEKFVLLSPGYIRNYDSVTQGQEIDQFIYDHIEHAGKDIIDELLIKLTTPNETFAQNDAHILLGEVSAHAISEI